MRPCLMLVSCLFVASCATKKEDDASLHGKSMEERFTGKGIRQDANGNWPAEVRNAKLTEADKQSAYFTGESNLPKRYQAGEFQKTSWWGGKEYDRKAYTGNTDGNRFRTAASGTDSSAREGGVAANTPGAYQTGDYRTGAAREENAKRLDKPSDAATDERRKAFPEPVVGDHKEQRKMDIKAVRSILGRE